MNTYLRELDAPSASVVRSLGAMEHVFWLVDQHSPVHFVVGAEISGAAPTVQGWRMALDQLQRRHPNASVHVAVDELGVPRFYRQEDPQPIPLRIISTPDASLEQELERELVTPFVATQGPLLRAALLRRADTSVILLTAHHSIADGMSLVYALRDLILFLSGETLPTLDLLPPHEQMMSGVVPAGPPTPTEPAPSYALRAKDEQTPSVRYAQLTQNLTRRLQTLARRNETTVHGTLMAAASIAARRLNILVERPLRIASPVNGRKMLDTAPEDIILAIGGGVAVVEGATQDFWEIARIAKTAVAVTQTRESIAGMLALLQQAVADQPDMVAVSELMAVGFGSEVLMSNLGRFPLEVAGHFKVEAAFGPAVLSCIAGHQTLGLATANDSLSLLHSSYKPWPGFLEAIQAVLEDACS